MKMSEVGALCRKVKGRDEKVGGGTTMKKVEGRDEKSEAEMPQDDQAEATMESQRSRHYEDQSKVAVRRIMG